MIIVLILYWLAISGLFLYGLNCYVLLFLFRRNPAPKAASEPALWPPVAVQLPIYNEPYVVERLLEAVCAFDYPADKLEIQVLDDSNDDTPQRLAHLARRFPQIKILRRSDRSGFKAGALKAGMEKSDAEIFAIFDADFVPQSDFLKRTIPYFSDPKVAFVQARWDHLNANHSWLTACQALAIDGHFTIEQAGRARSHLLLNFNGTAGAWRRSAIEDAGGWQCDTLTEDLDLSYRVQLRGWRGEYLLDLAVPAEIPPTIAAFKSQQRRWAKGSIQTAIKLLPSIWRHPLGLFRKVQATLHLTHYLVHPLMLAVALLSYPALSLGPTKLPTFCVPPLLLMLTLGTLSSSSLYICAQKHLHPDWKKRVLRLPLLMFLGTGIALSNSIAVFEALFGRQTAFVRTPKWNLALHENPFKRKRYKSPVGSLFILELMLALYCARTLFEFIDEKHLVLLPFLLIYSIGFAGVAVRALWETYFWSRVSP